MAGAVAMWLASTGGVGGPVGTARQRGLLAATAALLAVAVQLRRRPLLAGGLAASAAVAWSARGQVGVANGPLGIVLDSVHLAAGAVWAGALGLLVADLWAGRHDPDALLARARRYAGLATVPVGVLAAAGVVSAVLMVPTAADLWETGYGRLLIVKTVLFAAALGLAWRARRRLRDGRLAAVRRLTRPEAALVAIVLVVASVLANTAPPPPPIAAASLLGPPPLEGPVVRDAGLAGILTVAVAAGDGRLQVEVLVPDDESDKADAEVTVDGRGPAPGRFASCGDGCLTASWQPRAGESTIRVAAAAPGWRGGTFTTTVRWPPAPEDPGLLERVVEAMRAEPAMEMVERTSSGPDSVVVPMRSTAPAPSSWTRRRMRRAAPRTFARSTGAGGCGSTCREIGCGSRCGSTTPVASSANGSSTSGSRSTTSSGTSPRRTSDATRPRRDRDAGIGYGAVAVQSSCSGTAPTRRLSSRSAASALRRRRHRGLATPWTCGAQLAGCRERARTT